MLYLWDREGEEGEALEISWQCNTSYMPKQSANCLWRITTAIWKCTPSDWNTMFPSQSVLLSQQKQPVSAKQHAHTYWNSTYFTWFSEKFCHRSNK